MNILDYLEERFGIPKSAFDDYGIYAGTKGKVYLGPKALPQKPELKSVGMLIARTGGHIKPTTNLIQLFGHLATKNVVKLEKGQAAAYMKGGDLRVEPGDDGYVVVEYAGQALGCGRLKGGMLENMVPKAKRLDIRFY